ncbi:hypothetical protein ACFL25_00480 [Patescibacteria group bacterium]
MREKQNQSISEYARWIGVIEPRDKMYPELWEGKIGSWALSENNVLLDIRLHDSMDWESVKTKIKSYKVEIINESPSFQKYRIRIDKDLIHKLAEINEIVFIDQIPPPPTTTED